MSKRPLDLLIKRINKKFPTLGATRFYPEDREDVEDIIWLEDCYDGKHQGLPYQLREGIWTSTDKKHVTHDGSIYTFYGTLRILEKFLKSNGYFSDHFISIGGTETLLAYPTAKCHITHK
tara:strand:- start:391 stop:750 length:360 start_codon:yes stop_codon:yes gene_type:complete